MLFGKRVKEEPHTLSNYFFIFFGGLKVDIQFPI